ncbi:hypothetical protein QR680_012058 [Steinernema hermaphroditum]|uniref:Uncharacterized protein n=1 Tax=Steinernema hermaphroditum TaxID=289476 RepID=A0AA39I0S5_9BILA|nr:hypothetical protein QR680_012058 [Steinernema hermaphroditum]
MSFFFDLLDFVKRSKKSIWIVLAPIVLLPILQFGSKEASCCYCILLLTFYWLGEVVPIAVTSILPMLLFPLLGVMTAEDTAREYLKDTTMMLVITVMAAIAVEECNLHRRIALKLLTKTGSKPQWIMASFMAATCFLSCWMDDCAATALMLPIAFATLESMNLDDEETGAKKPVTNSEAWTTVALEHSDDPVKIPAHHEPPKEDRTIWKAMILSCSYASLIGGTGTVIGTAPNLIFRDNVQTWYPHGETGVTYLSWMAFAVPPMVLYLFASWVTLQIILIGPKKLFKMYAQPTEEDEKKAVRVKNSILRAYQQLGPMSFAEKSVLALYIVMILSWMTSDPGFMPGWQSLVPHGDMISDASVGILIIFIMFVWPRECPSFSVDPEKPKKSSGSLLNWEVVHDKFPWSLLFLVGAGFATSRAVELSGLSTMVSCFAMDRLTNGSAFYMEVVITTFVTFVTELMGNSGTASIFIPISFSIGEALKINPLYLALPLTISASFSFMFPMATPPNAIVYETGMISMFEMAYTGFLLDLVCIGITLLNLNTWTFWLFDLGHFPEGIQDRNTTLMCAPSF